MRRTDMDQMMRAGLPNDSTRPTHGSDQLRSPYQAPDLQRLGDVRSRVLGPSVGTVDQSGFPLNTETPI